MRDFLNMPIIICLKIYIRQLFKTSVSLYKKFPLHSLSNFAFLIRLVADQVHVFEYLQKCKRHSFLLYLSFNAGIKNTTGSCLRHSKSNS